MSRPQARATLYEGEPFVYTDYLTKLDGTLVTQADVTEAWYSIFQVRPTGEYVPVEDQVELDVSEVVFDAVQLDGYRVRDGRGYNVKVAVDGQDITLEGGRTYILTVLLQTTEGPRIGTGELTVLPTVEIE